MLNCTDTPFICISRIHIVGTEIEGTGWFIVMLLVAFGLQVAANFIWLKNSQYSRELLQLKRGDKKRATLVCLSVGWTALSTIVWIARVIFVMGSNLWMFLVILGGNVIGTYLASTQQAADDDNTLNIITEEFINKSDAAYKLQRVMSQLPNKAVMSQLPKNVRW